MSTSTILLLMAAILCAASLVWWQYRGLKTKFGSLALFLAILRFLAVFLVLLLLISPKINHYSYQEKKPVLKVLLDNSSSLAAYRSNVNRVLEDIENSDLKKKFKINYYRFDQDLRVMDSLDFGGNQTNISKAIHTVQKIHKDSDPILLISDGNQTFGTDYSIKKIPYKPNVYGLVVGDTTTVEDLKIDRVNMNKFSFLNHQYPIELLVSYQGNKMIMKSLSIYESGKKLFSKTLQFSKKKPTTIVRTYVPAKKVGTQYLKFKIEALENEKNTTNNTLVKGIEVIDEQTHIGIVSSKIHPDLGALQKSIGNNLQRKVEIVSPNISKKKLEKLDILILFQPDASFSSVISAIKQQSKPVFLITGNTTDWNDINKFDLGVTSVAIAQKETMQGVLSSDFTLFEIPSTLTFENWPPLESTLGKKRITVPFTTILNKKINGIETEEPLLASYRYKDNEFIVLFGEHLWKWRLHYYLENEHFKGFDNFIGKLIFILHQRDKKERLKVVVEPTYYQNNEIRIDASYYNEAYEFDKNAQLQIDLKSEKNTFSYPMSLRDHYFSVALDQLPQGTYRYTISVKGTNKSKKGTFVILPLNVEQQFASSNKAMFAISQNTEGKTYLLKESTRILKNLQQNNRYKTMQIENIEKRTLIDYIWILIIILLFLTLEWFFRKYNGLT